MKSKKKIYSILNIVVMFIIILNIGNTVIASGLFNGINNMGSDISEELSEESRRENGEVDFWGNATKWFNKVNSGNEDLKVNETTQSIIADLENMVLVLGTTVIVIATIFLGIKYMIGSVDSKTDAKEGLINLLVACLFFFGWNSIKNLLFPGNSFIFIESTDTNYTNPIGRIYNIVVYILQFAAIIAIIYVGIKYIFAGVQGKTELKEKSGTFVIGVILAFCSTGFLTYISKVINDALN